MLLGFVIIYVTAVAISLFIVLCVVGFKPSRYDWQGFAFASAGAFLFVVGLYLAIVFGS